VRQGVRRCSTVVTAVTAALVFGAAPATAGIPNKKMSAIDSQVKYGNCATLTARYDDLADFSRKNIWDLTQVGVTGSGDFEFWWTCPSPLPPLPSTVIVTDEFEFTGHGIGSIDFSKTPGATLSKDGRTVTIEHKPTLRYQATRQNGRAAGFHNDYSNIHASGRGMGVTHTLRVQMDYSDDGTTLTARAHVGD
jgi:hypothetical protein